MIASKVNAQRSMGFVGAKSQSLLNSMIQGSVRQMSVAANIRSKFEEAYEAKKGATAGPKKM